MIFFTGKKKEKKAVIWHGAVNGLSDYEYGEIKGSRDMLLIST